MTLPAKNASKVKVSSVVSTDGMGGGHQHRPQQSQKAEEDQNVDL
jgi:hypothetical protein